MQGSFKVQVEVPAYVVYGALKVKGELRWEDYRPETLAGWTRRNGLSEEVSFGPIGSSGNGIYTFTLRAKVCYKQDGKVKEEDLVQEAKAAVFIPWTIGDPESFAWFLWKEAETANYIEIFGNLKGGQPMRVEGLATALPDEVKEILQKHLIKGYLNKGRYPPSCGGLEFCYSVHPVQVRIYSAKGIEGFYQEGHVSLGNYGGQKDSRAFELGPKQTSGILIVQGYRHDYILLSERGDFEGEVQVVEMPKGSSELIRRALALSVLERQARLILP